MINKLVVLALVMASFVSAQGQAGGSYSIKEATEFAMSNTQTLKNSHLEYEKSVMAIRETAARGLPSISVGADYTYNYQIAKQPVPADFFGGAPGDISYLEFGVDHSMVGTANLNQLLFDASYFVALRATKVVKEAATLTIEKTEIEIAAEVHKAYYQVLVADETRSIHEENLVSLQKSFMETRELFKNGFVEEQEVEQLELLVGQIQNKLNNSKRQVALAKMLLNFSMGLPVMGELNLTSTLAELINDGAVPVSTEFKVEEHVDFRSLDVAERGSELQLSNSRAAYYPKLNGFVRHQQSQFQNEAADVFDFNQYWIPSTAIGVSLSWNLLEGFARTARVQTAKLDLQKMQMDKEMAENNLKMNYEKSSSDYLFSIDNYQTAKRNAELSKKIRNKTRVKYSEGISSSMELTQAETQYLENQERYIGALLAMLSAKEDLQKAIGK